MECERVNNKPRLTAIEIAVGDVFLSRDRFFLVGLDPIIEKQPCEVFTVDLGSGEWRRFHRNAEVERVVRAKFVGEVE